MAEEFESIYLKAQDGVLSSEDSQKLETIIKECTLPSGCEC